MRTRNLRIILLLMVLVSLSSVTAFAAQVGSPTPLGQIHAGMFPVGSQQRVDYCHFLNVRRGASPSHAAFTYLSRGDVVNVLEYSQKWVRVDTSSGQGWIYAGYLSRDSANDAPLASVGGSTVRVGSPTPSSIIRADMFPVGSQSTVDFCSHLNVRRGAGRNHEAFTHLTRGDVVTVLEYSGQWVRTDTPRGQGWVFAGYLSNGAVLSANASVASTRSSGSSSGGNPIPVNQITASMFPVGSQQTVDYTSFLNVRRGPSVNNAAFTTLSRGTGVTVLEYSGKWVRVDTSGGQGWIYAGYLPRPGTVASGESAPGWTGEQQPSNNDSAGQGSSSTAGSGGGNSTLAGYNRSGDTLFDTSMSQLRAYEGYGTPPAAAMSGITSGLTSALSYYETTLLFAEQMGLNDDPEAVYARNRIAEIRRVLGQ